MSEAKHKLGLEIDVTRKGDGLQEVRQEAQRTESAIRDLRQELMRGQTTWEDANNATIRLKSEFKSLRQDGVSPLEPRMKDLSSQIGEAEKAEHALITETRKLVAEQQALDTETGQVDHALVELTGRLDKAEWWITKYSKAEKEANENAKELTRSTDKLGDEVQDTGKKIGRVGDEVETLGKKVGVTAHAMGQILADGLQEAARAAVDFAKDSHQAYLDFEKSSREVFTLIPELSGAAREQLKKDALGMAADLGILPEEILPALYQGLSAGIPEENLLSDIEIASQAARAGVADLDTTLGTGQAIVNAYGEGVYDLERVYDALFYTIANGVVTMDDINSGMSQITSVAGEAGVGIEDISSALVVMTKQGDSFNEAASLMSNLLAQIQIEGSVLGATFKEAAGIGFKEFIAQGHSLADAMGMLQNHADEAGDSLLNIVGGGSPFFRDIEAARGVVELAGRHLGELEEHAEGARNATGMMGAAAAEMGEAAELSSLRAKASFELLKIAIGEELNPAFDTLYRNATQFLDLWSGDKANEIGNQVKAVLEQAEATDEWADAMGRLATARDTARASGDDATEEILHEATKAAVREVAIQSKSIEEFADTMEEQGFRITEAYGQMTFLIGHQRQSLEKAFDEGQILKMGQALEGQDQIILGIGREWEKAAEEAAAYQALLLNPQALNMAEMYADAAGAFDQISEAAQAGYGYYGQFVEQIQNARVELDGVAATVKEIKDGDTITIEIDGELTDIRLQGGDTPETAKEWLNKAGTPFGEEALEFTQEFLLDPEIRFVQAGDRETFGRQIGQVFNKAGQSLEEELTRQGLELPLPVTLTQDEELTARLTELATEAAEAGRGIFENEAVKIEFLDRINEGLLLSQEELLSIYDRQIEAQADLKAGFMQMSGPLTELEAAYSDLTNVQGEGAEEAQERVEMANAAIIESYRDTALAAFEAATAGQEGAFEAFVALQVELGNMTQEMADARLEASRMTSEAQLLGESIEFQELSTQQQATALGLLAEGYVETHEEALNLASLYEDYVNPEMAIAEENQKRVNEELIKFTERTWETEVYLDSDTAEKDAIRLHDTLLNTEGVYIAEIKLDEADARAKLLAFGGDLDRATRNRTVRIDVEAGGKVTIPDGKGGGNKMAGGGRVEAGQPYIVGDGPGGQILPTTEMIVPDTSGYVVSGRDLASMMNNPGGQTGTAGPQMSDNSTIIINNHSREAAALTNAMVAERRRKKLDEYMGVR